MQWRPTILADELSQYVGYLPSLRSATFRNFLVSLLVRLSRFIGLQIAFILPVELKEYAGDEDNLRAIRLLHRLRQAGIIDTVSTEGQLYPDEPFGKVTFAHFPGKNSLGYVGKGAHLEDYRETLWPALGEAVERYSQGNFFPKKSELVDASWEELKGQKMDIFSMLGRIDPNLSHPKHYFDVTEKTTFRWVKAYSLPDNKSIWIPLQLFSLKYLHTYAVKNPLLDDAPKEPLLAAPITTGAATGQDIGDAIVRGILEVVERDAFMIYWLSQTPAKRIDISSFNSERFNRLRTIADKFQLEVHALYLETDVPVHTVCSVMIDKTGIGPAVMVGAKSGLDFEEVVYSAFSETLAQRNVYRRNMDAHADNLGLPTDVYAIGHQERMSFWFQKESLPHIQNFISGPITHEKDFVRFAYEGTKKEQLNSLINNIISKGHKIYYREIVPDHLRVLIDGLSVVMVKIPTMAPLYLEEVLRGNYENRLFEIPRSLGYATTNEIYTVPHPFP